MTTSIRIVIADDEPAELQDIRPGDFVKVTKQTQGEQEMAVKIEAKRAQEESPASEQLEAAQEKRGWSRRFGCGRTCARRRRARS